MFIIEIVVGVRGATLAQREMHFIYIPLKLLPALPITLLSNA